MIFYTPMPMDIVMEGFDKQEEPSYFEITLNGVHMQVQAINERQASIVRILSCELQDYLNPQYAPGKLIEFQPVLR
ncbi:YlzJ-like family protein [Paenibacillus hamazuiensis]|uniref:YlzJ-like family protein n=1 Tax=Paenibacillus hamazuiensis TaxID=2936508 RepID=UPI002010BA81|nr:YlzJ-like family protein [Paenibacillus hamazuiensis]